MKFLNYKFTCSRRFLKALEISKCNTPSLAVSDVPPPNLNGSWGWGPGGRLGKNP